MSRNTLGIVELPALPAFPLRAAPGTVHQREALIEPLGRIAFHCLLKQGANQCIYGGLCRPAYSRPYFNSFSSIDIVMLGIRASRDVLHTHSM